MAMPFEFATAARIVFGAGTLREAGPIARSFGARALVVTGRTPGRAERLLAILAEQGVSAVTFPLTGEPEVETIRAGVVTASRGQCDLVIGFGGGAALDAAKAIAVMLTHEGELLDYLELIGKGKTLTAAAVIKLLKWMRVGMIGHPYQYMEDLMTDPFGLRSTIGPTVVHIEPEEDVRNQ